MDFGKMYGGAYSSLHPEQPYSLDITDYKESGQKLKKRIENEVRDTQTVVVHALPNKIIMTQRQYNDLSGQPEMMDMVGEGQSYWLYRTKLNVMEVEIKEGTASEVITIEEDV